MMIYQFRDKKQISQKKKIIRIFIVLILFLVLVFSGIIPIFGKFFHYIGKPIWEAKKVTLNSINDLSYLTKTKSSLLLENKKLLEEISYLKVSMIDYQIIKNENEKLKELLGNIPIETNFVLADILVKPNNSPYDTLIIDVGQKDNILKDSKVYINGNVPIGVINKVYLTTSIVELYSNPGKVTMGIINDSGISIDLIGRGGGNFEMVVPFELTVPKGSMVTLPGIQTEIVAIIEDEISEPTDPVKKVILRSPVNVQNQKWVQIKMN